VGGVENKSEDCVFLEDNCCGTWGRKGSEHIACQEEDKRARLWGKRRVKRARECKILGPEMEEGVSFRGN